METPVANGKNGSNHDIKLEDVKFELPEEGTLAAEAFAANAALKVSKVDKGYHKFRGMKRPKMKNLNIVKYVNKRTKAKASKRHFSRQIKGKVIDGVSELYVLTAGMMLGIRCSMGYNQKLRDKPITVEDFSYVEKVSFPAAGNSTGEYPTPPHPLIHTFKFKTYSPRIFQRIRDFFGISSASYMMSVCGNYSYLEFISNSKSGQFFFYSHDGKFMIKTQTKEENKFMKKILPHYYKYVTENPHTFLVRILAMHRVKMYHLKRKVHFVIMSSVFDTREEIHSIYDLKGSLIGRSATEKEKASGGVLKDQDLLNGNLKFHLGSKKPAFIEQLHRDAEFLASLNIMDYSLLVGTHDRTLRVRVPIDPSPVKVPFSVNVDTPVDTLQKRNSGIFSNVPFRKMLSKKFSTELNGDTPGNISPGNSAYRRGSAPPDLGNDQINIQDVINAPARRRLGSIDKTDYDGETSGRRRSIDKTDESEVGTPSKDKKAGKLEDSMYEDEEIVSISSVGTDDEGDSIIDDGNDEEIDVAETGRASLTGRVSAHTIEAKGVDKILADDNDLSVSSRIAHTLTSLPLPLSLTTSSPNDKQDDNKDSEAAKVVEDELEVYGYGATKVHPWTARADGGINSRMSDETRGKEIYYMGVIDILQQYNFSKRAETIFKGLVQDRTKISSVDAKFYAERFVKFIDENTD